jgi:hypothetical protein
MEMSGQFHDPAALPPGKQPRYPLYRGLGGPQSWSGRYKEENNLLPIPGIKSRLLGRPARSLVPIPTELIILIFLTKFGTQTNRHMFCLMNQKDCSSLLTHTSLKRLVAIERIDFFHTCFQRSSP